MAYADVVRRACRPCLARAATDGAARRATPSALVTRSASRAPADRASSSPPPCSPTPPSPRGTRGAGQTQSYGPEARGGASKAEVIVSDTEIDFPEVTAPDVTVCLSQEAFDAYAAQTVRGGACALRRAAGRVRRRLRDCACVGLPFTELAETELGKAIAANIVMLGALQALTAAVTLEALRDAVRRRLPAKIVELNLKALELGAASAAEHVAGTAGKTAP